MSIETREWMMLIAGAIVSVIIQKLYEAASALFKKIKTSAEIRTTLRKTFNKYTRAIAIDFLFLGLNSWGLVAALANNEPPTKADILLIPLNTFGILVFVISALIDGMRWSDALKEQKRGG